MITKNGPIILIDDDIDDLEITSQIITELGVKNEIVCFSSCTDALEHLQSDKRIDQPFVILSDVNLPKMNGVELKKRIDQNDALRKKSIPFIFLSTAYSQAILNEVYELRVQGYFIKGTTINELKETLEMIFRYWTICKHPNSL